MRHLALFTVLLTLPAVTAFSHAERLRAGYQASFIQPSDQTFGGALAAVPGSPEHLYTAMGGAFGTDQSLVRFDLSDISSPVSVEIVSGAFDSINYPAFVNGDDVLDSTFGTIGGMVELASGQIVILDNNTPFGMTGDTVYIATDLNADGDMRDVVGGTPEVEELIDLSAALPGVIPAGTGFGGFSGTQIEVAPVGSTHAGDLFLIDADGANASEVIRIDNPTGAVSAEVFFAGLDYGGGIAIDGNVVYAAELDEAFWPGRLWRLEDLNADGDAMDVGESTLVSSLLSGAYDIALTNDGALKLTTLSEELTSLSATVAETPLGLMVAGLGGFFSLSDLVAEETADPFAENTAGQRLYSVGNDFAGTSALIVFEPAPVSPVTTAAFFDPTTLSPPDAQLAWGSALTVSPTVTTEIYGTLGSSFNSDHDIWKIDITDPTYPTHTLVAAGALDTAQWDGSTPNFVTGEGVLDSLFGTIGGMAALPTGELILIDNSDRAFASPFAIPGDTIYLAQDLNADGDFLDVVDVLGTPTPEVAELLPSIPGAPAGSGFGGFSGAQVEIGPDGAAYLITADGTNTGEVLRVYDLLTTASAEVFWEDGANGVDYGAGVAWVGSTLFTGDLDETFSFARVRSHADGNADDDALDGGETVTVTSSLFAMYDLAAGPNGTLWRASGFGPGTVDELDTATGASLQSLVNSTHALGDLVFTATPSEKFIPAIDSDVSLVTQTTNFAGTTFLHLVRPNPTVPVELSVFTAE